MACQRCGAQFVGFGLCQKCRLKNTYVEPDTYSYDDTSPTYQMPSYDSSPSWDSSSSNCDSGGCCD